MEVNVHEAKTHLSKLLKRVAAGEEIIISKAGKPIAKLTPMRDRPLRRFGIDEGVFEVPEDFDATLPEEVLQAFETP
ncbi:MAG TPA: type II toxin-antitoxin system Phd/YefM family antitoxin [Candidatus Margulisiibacteriota bacterium]|nr:type II toxin-antitoxin system Phd/YefM family antitoxin [Candidatus Margulisiibacteriota bacterium]